MLWLLIAVFCSAQCISPGLNPKPQTLEQGIPEFQSLPQAATLGSSPKLWEGPAPLALPNTKPM
jgi:hypothetical protein